MVSHLPVNYVPVILIWDTGSIGKWASDDPTFQSYSNSSSNNGLGIPIAMNPPAKRWSQKWISTSGTKGMNLVEAFDLGVQRIGSWSTLALGD